MKSLTEKKQPNISVAAAENGAIIVRSEGWEHDIPLSYKVYGEKLVLVNIPHSYLSLLSGNERFERLKQLLQPYFKGIKIETRTGAPIAWQRAAENRAKAKPPVERRRSKALSRS
jgi:hypothetical protein